MPQHATQVRTGCRFSTTKATRMDNTLPKAVATAGMEAWVEADEGVVDMAADVDVDSMVSKGATSIKL